MAYIPGFLHDVFISYASADDVNAVGLIGPDAGSKLAVAARVASALERGALPGRVDATLGLGFSYVQLSDQFVAGGGDEQVLELTYRLTLGDHIFLQPDLQFIIHPGAADSAATAVAAGLRLNLRY